MDILVTDVIRGTSGQFNKFGFTSKEDDFGKFIGVEVVIEIYGDDSDLCRENLIKVLERQLQIHLDQLSVLDQVDGCGAFPSVEKIRTFSINATRTTQEYLAALKDRAQITYFTP